MEQVRPFVGQPPEINWAMRIGHCGSLLLALFSALPLPVCAANPEQPSNTAEVEYFEKYIRPVLAQHCYECHSAKVEEVQGGLLLDHRQGWAKGGDSGPAV